MKRVARDFVPNGTRDIRATPKDCGGMTKGNARQVATGRWKPIAEDFEYRPSGFYGQNSALEVAKKSVRKSTRRSFPVTVRKVSK